MVYRIGCLLTLAFLASGCSPRPTTAREEPETAPMPLGERFDSNQCGDLAIRVEWSGDRPSVPPFEEASLSHQGGWIRRRVPNPHAPHIGDRGGLERVIFYLRGIDPARSKPWSILEPRVSLTDGGIAILQPDSTSIGFVRRGTKVEIAAESDRLQSLRARGTAFFTLMFPPHSTPLRRRLAQDGFVELSNATGTFSTRAHLLVSPHPYCGSTDANGLLQLSQVPDGEYELICWLPNFKVNRIERDPETGIQVRQFYAPPVEKKQSVRIERGKTSEAKITFSPNDFAAATPEKNSP